MNEFYRKQRVTFPIPGHAHSLTWSSKNRQPGLHEPPFCGWIVESLRSALSKHDFGLVAWVIMPEHMHLLVWPRDPDASIAKFQQSVKQKASRSALFAWQVGKLPGGEKWLKTNPHTGKQGVHLWQRGGGHDFNVFEADKMREKIQYIHYNPVRRGLVEQPKEWRLSSYSDMMELREPMIELDQGWYSGR